MSLFKQRKNKKFNIPSRFNESDADLAKKNFSEKWQEARNSNVKRKRSIPLGMLFVLLVLLIVAMYIIEKKYM